MATYDSNGFAYQSTISKYLLQDYNNKNQRFCRFYGIIKLKNMKLRPICPTINYPLEYASKYLHIKLFNVMELGDTYIKDSTDLINQLNNQEFPDDVILSTFDIKDMYPSIPINGCIYAVKEMITIWSKFPDAKINPNEIDFIIDLLSLVLKNNYIQYEGKFFFTSKRNGNGTSMCSSCILHIHDIPRI